MVFPGEYGVITIDETSLSNGELYTIVTNKAAEGRKGTIAAMVRGTQTERIEDVLDKILRDYKDVLKKYLLIWRLI